MLHLALLLALQSGDMETVRDVEYAKLGGKSLLLDLYLPKRKEEKRPAIVCIHGGGWRAGDKKGMKLADEFARRGFVSASINYRLSDEAPYPAAVDDCRAAVRWIRENAAKYGVDPNRLGVYGTSAGGHLSLMVGTLDDDPKQQTSARVQAVCSWFGPSDFTKGAGKDGAFRKFIGGSYEEIPEIYKEASPITHVSQDDPPTLLIHGDADEVVPLGHSEWMLKALQEVGVEAELVTVKNGGHGFRGKGIQPSMDDIRSKTMEFFEKQLKR